MLTRNKTMFAFDTEKASNPHRYGREFLRPIDPKKQPMALPAVTRIGELQSPEPRDF
jgi:hypothetical protein